MLALSLLMQVLYYISSVIGPNLPPEQLASILSTLLDGLQGRTWDGKVISISFALEHSNHSINQSTYVCVQITSVKMALEQSWLTFLHGSFLFVCSQEALLKALHKVCIQMKLINILTSNTTTLTSPTTITSTILAQCRKKQQPAYQLVAMETIGGVVSSLEVDVFSELSEIAFPILLPVSKIVYVCVHSHVYHCASVCLTAFIQ